MCKYIHIKMKKTLITFYFFVTENDHIIVAGIYNYSRLPIPKTYLLIGSTSHSLLY